MVHSVKKRDTLISLQGTSADVYKDDVTHLLYGTLPPGWKKVLSSDETFVAFNKKKNIYYKEFLSRNSLEKIKSVFRGSRCQRAVHQAGIMHKEHLPTPHVLCWGENRGKSFLISEAYDGTGFYDFLVSHYSPPLSLSQIKEKRLLLKNAGELIGRLHRKGICHGDLRPNNVLVRKNGNVFHFSFIDIESNNQKRKLSAKQITKNLVQFSMIKSEHLNRTDLFRLYKAYKSEFPLFNKRNEKVFLKNIYIRRHYRIIDSIVSNFFKKECKVFKKSGYEGICRVGSLLEKELMRGIDPGKWFLSERNYLKKDSNIVIKHIKAYSEGLLAKRFTSKNFGYHLKVWTKKERVFRLWEMSHRFKAIGIPVAEPVGFILEGTGVWRTTSYFYSQYLEGKENLKSVSQYQKKFPEWLVNHNFIMRFASILASLHNSGYCHGDTKWKNILVDADSGDLWLVDLDGAQQAKLPLNRCMCKDISRFIVDMIEYPLPVHQVDDFLDHYCRRRNLTRKLVEEETEPIIQKILKRHQKKEKVV